MSLYRIRFIINVNREKASPARACFLFLSGCRASWTLCTICLTLRDSSLASSNEGKLEKNSISDSSDTDSTRSTKAYCNSSVRLNLLCYKIWLKSILTSWVSAGSCSSGWVTKDCCFASSSRRCCWRSCSRCKRSISSSCWRLLSTRNYSLQTLHQFLAFRECMPSFQVWFWSQVSCIWRQPGLFTINFDVPPFFWAVLVIDSKILKQLVQRRPRSFMVEHLNTPRQLRHSFDCLRWCGSAPAPSSSSLSSSRHSKSEGSNCYTWATIWVVGWNWTDCCGCPCPGRWSSGGSLRYLWFLAAPDPVCGSSLSDIIEVEAVESCLDLYSIMVGLTWETYLLRGALSKTREESWASRDAASGCWVSETENILDCAKKVKVLKAWWYENIGEIIKRNRH